MGGALVSDVARGREEWERGRCAPGEAADEGDELVEVRRAEVAQGGTEDDDAEAERVLLPLDQGALLSTPLENAVFHDAHCRE